MRVRGLLSLLVAWVAFTGHAAGRTLGALPPEASPLEARQPIGGLKDAVPLTTYVATSGAKGLGEEGDEHPDLLRYTWSLPEGFDGKARDVILILPGTGLDHRWGARVYDHRTWRRNDIVVCIDGTRELLTGGRTFGRTPRDAAIFRDVTLEIVRSFPTRRIYLYGHNEGGFFALVAATNFPRLYNGAVVHGGGLWNSTRVGPSPRGVPICFLHGTEDQVAPYMWAVDARDELVKNEFRIVGLRRVYGHKHEPEGVEASACIDYVMGMTSEDAHESLSLAHGLLSGAGGRTPMFGLAYAVLARFELGSEKELWPRGFKAADDAVKADAEAMRMRVETLGLRHAAVLRAQIKDAAGLRAATLDVDAPTPAWIGHLLAAREDWRGVPAVESLLADLKCDEVLAEHDAAARVMLEAMSTEAPEVSLPVVRRQIGACFLFEALPKDLLNILESWVAEAELLKLKAPDLEAAALVRRLMVARERGREAFRSINAEWQVEKAPAGK